MLKIAQFRKTLKDFYRDWIEKSSGGKYLNSSENSVSSCVVGNNHFSVEFHEKIHPIDLTELHLYMRV